MPALKITARKISDPAAATTQCAVLPVYSGKRLSSLAATLDLALGGTIKAALALGDFTGKPSESLQLPGVGGAKRLLLVGCGDRRKFDRAAAIQFVATVCKALGTTQAKDALLHIEELELNKLGDEWLLQLLARELVAANYRYTETLSKPGPRPQLAQLTVNTGGQIVTRRAQQALDRGRHIGQGVNEARQLADLPGNLCTPNYLAQQARKLARPEPALTVKILEEKKMRELGMGALLSVSAGSDQPAKLIIMDYRGGKSTQKPYVLVGKGITFDSGGISLKPAAKMDEMKYDMGGAASVFGVIRAITEMKLELNVIGVIAAAENMPSGRATKPGDVVTSMSGKTIEVLNTDAEGRLVLCDALTYVEKFKPQAVIDIATLTGACIVALGHHATALYANWDELADQLLGAGDESHDRAWRMPLWDDYADVLKSNFADLPNVAGPAAGSVVAACFLAKFADKYHWAHLDVAGSAWNSSPKGATGRPVSLLTQYLIDRAS